jgi:hypothetical protein
MPTRTDPPYPGYVVQTILVPKDHPAVRGDPEAARAVAARHGDRVGVPDATARKNYFSFRQLDPDLIQKGTYGTYPEGEHGVLIVAGGLKPVAAGAPLQHVAGSCAVPKGKQRVVCTEVYRGRGLAADVRTTRDQHVAAPATSTAGALLERFGQARVALRSEGKAAAGAPAANPARGPFILVDHVRYPVYPHAPTKGPRAPGGRLAAGRASRNPAAAVVPRGTFHRLWDASRPGPQGTDGVWLYVFDEVGQNGDGMRVALAPVFRAGRFARWQLVTEARGRLAALGIDPAGGLTHEGGPRDTTAQGIGLALLPQLAGFAAQHPRDLAGQPGALPVVWTREDARPSPVRLVAANPRKASHR